MRSMVEGPTAQVAPPALQDERFPIAPGKPGNVAGAGI